jgi:hypothetical protein
MFTFCDAALLYLQYIKESPIVEMLYLVPHNPSVSQSLRLFRMLSAMYEDDGLTSSHSENARLFLGASSWTPLDHLLFIFKLHQPSRLIDDICVTEAKEAAQVQALRHDLADVKVPEQSVFLLTIKGPGNILSTFHLASQRFLEAALHFLAPKTGPFMHWRKLCIDSLRAGYKPYHTIATDSGWATPLGASLRRVLHTLHEGKVTWKTTGVIVNNALNHWNSMLADANVNMQEYVTEEILAWQNSRLPAGLVNKQASGSTRMSYNSHWILFTERLGLDAVREGDSGYKLVSRPITVDTYHHPEAGEHQVITASEQLRSRLHIPVPAAQHSVQDIYALHIPGAFPHCRLSAEEGHGEYLKILSQPEERRAVVWLRYNPWGNSHHFKRMDCHARCSHGLAGSRHIQKIALWRQRVFRAFETRLRPRRCVCLLELCREQGYCPCEYHEGEIQYKLECRLPRVE